MLFPFLFLFELLEYLNSFDSKYLNIKKALFAQPYNKDNTRGTLLNCIPNGFKTFLIGIIETCIKLTYIQY